MFGEEDPISAAREKKGTQTQAEPIDEVAVAPRLAFCTRASVALYQSLLFVSTYSPAINSATDLSLLRFSLQLIDSSWS